MKDKYSKFDRSQLESLKEGNELVSEIACNLDMENMTKSYKYKHKGESQF